MASRTSPPGTDSSPVVDIEDFVVESSVGWRNGSGQASPPVQYRQRDVRGISGGEGVDGPGGGGRSSFEVSVPQQRGDEQNEGGHDSLAQNELGGEPNVASSQSIGCRYPVLGYPVRRSAGTLSDAASSRPPAVRICVDPQVAALTATLTYLLHTYIPPQACLV